MEIFLRGYNTNMSLWDITNDPFVHPKKDEVKGKYKEVDKKLMVVKKKSLNLIFYALSIEIFNRIMHLKKPMRFGSFLRSPMKE